MELGERKKTDNLSEDNLSKILNIMQEKEEGRRKHDADRAFGSDARLTGNH